jgi:hypothetical protein
VEPTFSKATFRSLLRTGLDGGFRFFTFGEAAAHDAERACAVRHDVDSDPGAAVELAEVEANEGVRATYFVMLRSPVYNVFARESQELVERLTELGHGIGLHYDPAFPPRAGRSHTEQIDVELRVLEELLGVSVDSVTFHQPSLVPGAFEIEVRGAVKANDFPGYEFLTDANQDVRVFEAFDVFRTGVPRKLHLLIHPMWWVDETASPSELWERAIHANWERTQRQLLIERAYGSPRRLTFEPTT